MTQEGELRLKALGASPSGHTRVLLVIVLVLVFVLVFVFVSIIMPAGCCRALPTPPRAKLNAAVLATLHRCLPHVVKRHFLLFASSLRFLPQPANLRTLGFVGRFASRAARTS